MHSIMVICFYVVLLMLFLVACLPGQYISGESCLVCNRGTYQDVHAQSQCKECPENHISPHGANDETLCYGKCCP